MDTIVMVNAELNSLKDIGVKVPKKAFKYLETHESEIREFRNNGMRFSEIVDYILMIVK